MAKRKAARRAKPAEAAKKRPARTAKKRARQSLRKGPKRAAARPARARSTKPRGTATVRRTVKAAKAAKAAKVKTRRRVQPRAARPQPQAKPAVQAVPARTARLDRVRRTLEEGIPTPPSSLDMDRHGSAARSGRAEMEQNRKLHGNMSDVTGGDVDVNVDTAYFSGDEAPGGDNPTPDMDIVDDIGRALGVEYNDNEELKAGDKVTERDKHRWELDPASAEDYRHRD